MRTIVDMNPNTRMPPSFRLRVVLGHETRSAANTPRLFVVIARAGAPWLPHMPARQLNFSLVGDRAADYTPHSTRFQDFSTQKLFEKSVEGWTRAARIVPLR